MRPKALWAASPYKALTALFSMSLFLRVMALGGGVVELSVTNSLYTASFMLGYLLWSKKLSRVKNYVEYILGGYFLVIFPISLLYFNDIYACYLASLLYPIFALPSYLATLFFLSDHYGEKLNEVTGKFEAAGGAGWVIGLLIGAISSASLPIGFRTDILLFLSLSSLVVGVLLLEERIAYRMAKALKENLGILPLIDLSMSKLEEVGDKAVERAVASIANVANAGLFPRVVYVRVSLPKEKFGFYGFLLLIYLAMGIVGTQFLFLEKVLGLEDPQVFLVSLISSLVSPVIYLRAGRVKDVRKALILALIIRVFQYCSLFLEYYLWILPPLPFFLAYSLVDGFSWGYLLVLLNVISLRISKETVGTANFLNNLGYIAGALISGLIAYHLGLEIVLSLAGVFSALSLSVLLKARIPGLRAPRLKPSSRSTF